MRALRAVPRRRARRAPCACSSSTTTARSSIWRPVDRGSRLRRQIALTFDDGPGDATPAVLDALAALELRGDVLRHRPAGARARGGAAAHGRGGHAVGVHAWEHPDLGAEPERAPDEIDRCLAAVREAAGMAPDLFRPPFGPTRPRCSRQADARGLRTSCGTSTRTTTPAATRPPTASPPTCSRPCAGARSSCSTTAARWNSRARVLDALPRIADGLRERRLEAVTVPDLIA